MKSSSTTGEPPQNIGNSQAFIRLFIQLYLFKNKLSPNGYFLPRKNLFKVVALVFLHPRTLRNNAQSAQKIYCALLRDMVCSISKLPLMETFRLYHAVLIWS